MAHLNKHKAVLTGDLVECFVTLAGLEGHSGFEFWFVLLSLVFDWHITHHFLRSDPARKLTWLLVQFSGSSIICNVQSDEVVRVAIEKMFL